MKKIITKLNISFVVIYITIYLICLFFYLWEGQYRSLLISALVPGIGFVICSALRIVINAKRPYENGDAINLLDKKTKGKSFPSRHVFCVFTVALTCYGSFKFAGILLVLVGILVGVTRVKAGVHYIKDVVAGAVLGIAVGGIVLYLI